MWKVKKPTLASRVSKTARCWKVASRNLLQQHNVMSPERLLSGWEWTQRCKTSLLHRDCCQSSHCYVCRRCLQLKLACTVSRSAGFDVKSLRLRRLRFVLTSKQRFYSNRTAVFLPARRHAIARHDPALHPPRVARSSTSFARVKVA